jgi:hypothetical protein
LRRRRAGANAYARAGAIAKEATIYGFPMVDNYRILYSYFVDKGGPHYKAPWNTLVNNARVYTPDDTAIQTSNSDTPYSYVGADLRTEPLVFTVPTVEKGRYYSGALNRFAGRETQPVSGWMGVASIQPGSAVGYLFVVCIA